MQFFINMVIILLAKYVMFGIVNIINRWNHNPARFLGKISNAGIFFHEACHFLAAKALFLPNHLSDINIKGHLPGISSGMTVERSRDPRGLTMLQSILIAFAPAIVGTFAITELLNTIEKYWESDLWQDWVLIGGTILVILAIMMVAFPSRVDFKRIVEHMLMRPISTLRQIIVCIGSYLVFFFAQDYWFASFSWNQFYLEPLMLIGMIVSIEVAYVAGTFIFQKTFQYMFDFHPKVPKLTAIQPMDLARFTSNKTLGAKDWEKEFNSEFKI